MADLPENVPFVGSFAKTAEQKQILDVLGAADEVGRPFVMSKQVPAERLATMRKAFDETMQDKEFLADMDKQQLPVSPIDGEKAEAIVAKMMDAPPAVVAKGKAIFE